MKLILSLFALVFGLTTAGAAERPPNVVIIFLDDSGWGDFHPFGDPEYPTPHVEALAKEGTRYNQFYVPQAICSASRSALLSGCFPGRTKVFGAHGPNGAGLSPKFATMAEVLKSAGYATAHYGKWHCGDKPETRPLARGFDEHAGLMYSNDMWRFHPMSPEHWGKFPLQFWKGGKVEIEDVSKQDQTQLTTWATENAVDFIKRKKDEPFFVYLAHSMPHVPLFCSDKFLGKSGTGLYGDVIMEIDWSVGQVTKALADAGVTDNTLVIFSSDNGPWAGYGDHAGTTPFREAKATSFDGGVRSATVMRYPGKIKAGGVSESAMATIDLMPSVAKLCGAALPENEIDGLDVWPLIVGEKGAENPHEYYAVSTGNRFEGVISGDGKWKLHLPHTYRHVVVPGSGGFDAKEYSKPMIELSLFDMKNDPYEKENVIAKYPEVAGRLKGLADAHARKFFGKK